MSQTRMPSEVKCGEKAWRQSFTFNVLMISTPELHIISLPLLRVKATRHPSNHDRHPKSLFPTHPPPMPTLPSPLPLLSSRDTNNHPTLPLLRINTPTTISNPPIPNPLLGPLTRPRTRFHPSRLATRRPRRRLSRRIKQPVSSWGVRDCGFPPRDPTVGAWRKSPVPC